MEKQVDEVVYFPCPGAKDRDGKPMGVVCIPDWFVELHILARYMTSEQIKAIPGPIEQFNISNVASGEPIPLAPRP